MSATPDTTSTGAFRLEMESDGVAALVFDLPGARVNTLSSTTLLELDDMLRRIAGDASISIVLLKSGKADRGSFIVGADIEEILSINDVAEAVEKVGRAHEILARIGELPQKVIAVVDGTCLGGGLELILACDFRIASDHSRTSLGLPEVNLGIIPGFGGTQRLPRRIGIQPALQLILSGKPVDARKAHRLGLVDRVAPVPFLHEAALAFARDVLDHAGRRDFLPQRRPRLVSRLLEGSGLGRKMIRRFAQKDIRKKTGGHYPAPLRALEAVLDGFTKPLGEGLQLERDLVGTLIAGEISRNLITIFQASEKLRRGATSGDDGVDPGDGTAPPTRPRGTLPARRVGILGAGVMGGGIAALLARKGFHVRLKDIASASITTAYREAEKSFRALVGRRRMTRGAAENARAAISATTTTHGFRHVECVIEAVVEDIEIKKSVLREIEPLLCDDAVFATNTSALDIDEIASAARRPERVAGLHFFNPVHRMPLVEIVVGSSTSEATIDRLEGLAREIGKYPLRVKNGPGFLVNRLLMPYLNEAAYLFEEGYKMEAIDRAATAFGLPMGPFALIDEVGFDVALKVGSHLHGKLGGRAAPAALLARLGAAEKLLGKKSGVGFYTYRSGRRRGPNRTVFRYGGKGSLPEAPERWIARMLYPMVNEAARCLEEEIVTEPWQVDIAMIMGTGFPPFRGGPLRWADTVGLKKICAELDELATFTAEKGGARFESSAALRSWAERGGFYPASDPTVRENEPENTETTATSGVTG